MAEVAHTIIVLAVVARKIFIWLTHLQVNNIFLLVQRSVSSYFSTVCLQFWAIRPATAATAFALKVTLVAILA